MTIMKSDDPQAVAEACARIRQALFLIERAQTDLNSARIELSEVTHLAPLWTRAGKLYDDVKALWHRTNNALNKGGFGLSELHCQLLEQAERDSAQRAASFKFTMPTVLPPKSE